MPCLSNKAYMLKLRQSCARASRPYPRTYRWTTNVRVWLTKFKSSVINTIKRCTCASRTRTPVRFSNSLQMNKISHSNNCTNSSKIKKANNNSTLPIRIPVLMEVIHNLGVKMKKDPMNQPQSPKRILMHHHLASLMSNQNIIVQLIRWRMNWMNCRL